MDGWGRSRIGAVALGLAAVMAAGGCGATADPPFQRIAERDSAGASAVIEWNRVALRTTAAAPADPPREARSLAIVQGAVFDAVAGVSGGSRPDPGGEGNVSVAAVAAAAHASLLALYPAQRDALDAAYTAAVTAITNGPEKDAGIAAGRRAAAGLLAARTADHAGDAATGAPTGTAPGVGYGDGAGAAGAGPTPAAVTAPPGVWRPTPPANRPPLDPGWGGVTPFVLRRPAQFRPPAPYDLRSRAYARDLAEVKAVGSATSPVRTPEQSDTARFWVSTAPQAWNQPAQQLAIGEHLSAVDAARLFALLNFAEADAAIAAWDAKFAYRQWRPITGIREAAVDGNPATTADPEWTPLLATPPFPDDICGHSSLGAAAEAVLEAFFGRRPAEPFTVTSAATPGLVHRFTTFAAMEDEVINARVWGGVHWRTSCAAGRDVGRDVGRFVIGHALPKGRSIPG